jgi:hypothetical protein
LEKLIYGQWASNPFFSGNRISRINISAMPKLHFWAAGLA